MEWYVAFKKEHNSTYYTFRKFKKQDNKTIMLWEKLAYEEISRL